MDVGEGETALAAQAVDQLTCQCGSVTLSPVFGHDMEHADGTFIMGEYPGGQLASLENTERIAGCDTKRDIALRAIGGIIVICIYVWGEGRIQVNDGGIHAGNHHRLRQVVLPANHFHAQCPAERDAGSHRGIGEEITAAHGGTYGEGFGFTGITTGHVAPGDGLIIGKHSQDGRALHENLDIGLCVDDMDNGCIPIWVLHEEPERLRFHIIISSKHYYSVMKLYTVQARSVKTDTCNKIQTCDILKCIARGEQTLNRLFGFHDKEFYRLLFKLALPITLQYFISSSLYFVDNIFVGLLGPKEAAAIYAANSIYAVMNVCCFGLVSGCMIFYSQYWGDKDVRGVRQVMGINLIGVFIITSTFLVIMQTTPESLLSLFSRDPEVLKYAKSFVRVSSIGYIPNMLAFTFGAVLRSCNKVRLPMISSGIALGINTFLNWLLIFGNLGMPRLELRGSGIATLISAIVDLTIILSVTYIQKLPAAAKPRDMRFNAHLLKRVMARAMPVFIIELFWSLGGIFLFPVFIGAKANNIYSNSDILAALSLYTVTDRLAFVLFMGLCTAIAVIIGNKIGASEEDKAYLYGKRMLALGPVIGIAIAGLVIAVRPLVVSIYSQYSPAVKGLGMDFMMIAALAVPFIVYNFFMLVGVLRAGGDTRFCMIMDIGGMYLVSIPLVIVMVYAFNVPVQVAFAVYYAGEIVKIFFTTPRFRSKKWIVNLVRPEKMELLSRN